MGDTEDGDRLARRIKSLVLGDSSEERVKFDKELAARERARRAAVDEVAERLLGVRPEHGGTIYTQHPLMAGVLRQALQEAYDLGALAVTLSFMDMVASSRGGAKAGD